MVVDAEAPPGQDEEMFAALMAQEAGRAPPTVVNAGVPPGRDKETMAALGSAQETSRVPLTVLDAGAPPGRVEKTADPSGHPGGGWSGPNSSG
jgi:hypothetical protein